MVFSKYKNEILIMIIFFSFSQKLSFELMGSYFKISYFILPLLLVLLFFEGYKNGCIRLKVFNYEIFYAFLMIYLLFNIFLLSPDFFSKFKYFMLLVLSGLLYMFIKRFCFYYHISLNSFLKSYRMANVIFISLSILYYFLGVLNPVLYGSSFGAFYGEGLIRLEGLANNPIFFGLFITPYYFLLLLDVIKGKKKSIIPLILTIVAMLLTISKAPIGINLIITIGYLIYLSRKNVKYINKIVAIKITAISASIVFIFYLIPPINRIINNRIEDLLTSGGSGRFFIWSNAFKEYIKGNLLLGRGFFELVNFNGVMIAIHNTFLEFLFNTGIIGFSLYILIIITIIFKMTKIESSSVKAFSFITLLSLITQINFVTAPYHEVLLVVPLILTLSILEKIRRVKC